MRNWPSVAARWVRELLQPSPKKVPRLPGSEALASGALAVFTAEALVAEKLYHLSSPPETAEGATRTGDPAPPPLNAFGDPVTDAHAAHPAGALNAAVGATLAGTRTTLFLMADELASAAQQLQGAVERRAPLVIRTITRPYGGRDGSHRSLHAIADTGAAVFVARNIQEAIDLTFLARRVAETAMVPCVVSMDATETAHAVQDVRLPKHRLVREFVGAQDDLIDTPTIAQVVLFGERRPRFSRWFDPARPMAQNVVLSGPDRAAAAAGGKAFFADHVAEITLEATKLLSVLTGRDLGLVFTHEVAEAKHILVAQGAAVDVAVAVTDKLSAGGEERVGVLGVTTLRPLSVDAIRDALKDATRVTVLDRATDIMGTSAPLYGHIESVLKGRGPRLISAIYGLGGEALSGGQASAACANMQNSSSDGRTRSALWLGVTAPAFTSQFPKREVVLQKLKAAYPDLKDRTLGTVENVSLVPDGALSAAMLAWRRTLPEDALATLAGLLVDDHGTHVNARSELVERGLWKGTVSVAETPIKALGDEPVDIALVDGIDFPEGVNLPASIKKKGILAISSPLLPQDLWSALPFAWREIVEARKLKLYSVDAEFGELIRQAPRLLEEKLDRARIVDWSTLENPAPVRLDGNVPMAIRRLAGHGRAPDSVARFWSEVVQPRRGGEVNPGAMDPWLALGVVPPTTSTLHEMDGLRQTLPTIDAEKCTGCGRCWTACPDSALDPAVLTVEELLDAAGACASEPGAAPSPIAAKLQRAHKQLASRLSTLIAKSDDGAVRPEMIREAFEWLVEKMGVKGEELVEFEEIFEKTLHAMTSLPLTITDAFFQERHSEKKGSGGLLLLSMNPQACKGCGVCEAVCPDDAIVAGPADEATLTAKHSAAMCWEALSDTSGEMIQWASEREEIGPLASVLTSRYCQLAMSGGDDAEQGSGERLAMRLVTAVAEFELQRRMLGHVNALGELAPKLRKSIRDQMLGAVAVDDLSALDRALDGIANRNMRLDKVASQLEEMGQRTDLDGVLLKKIVGASREIESQQWEYLEGPHQIGRARYGLVIAGERLADWAGRFPHNPFAAPVSVDLTHEGASLAQGLAEGLMTQRVREARQVRLANVLLTPPSDLPVQEAAIKDLTAGDLTTEERAVCPPVIVMGSVEEFVGEGLVGLSSLLAGSLPVKVVVVDECDLLAEQTDPVSLALAHRDAFVVSTSVAHTDHFFRAVGDALKHDGPALIHIYASSPKRDGVEINSAWARAQGAVVSRVAPLLRYDPKADGVFGARLELTGNPSLEEPWGELENDAVTPAHFALGVPRYAKHFSTLGPDDRGEPIAVWAAKPASQRSGTVPTVYVGDDIFAVSGALAAKVVERLNNWQTLQELAGIVTPFTDAVRAEERGAIAGEHAAAIAALEAEHKAELVALEQRLLAEQAGRLRERLMQLAGYGAARLAQQDEGKA